MALERKRLTGTSIVSVWGKHPTLPGMSHAQVAKRIEVIAFDDEIPPPLGRRRGSQRQIEVQGHEVGIDGLVALDFIGFPYQSESCGFPPFPCLKEADEFVMSQVFVFAGHGGKIRQEPKRSLALMASWHLRLGKHQSPVQWASQWSASFFH